MPLMVPENSTIAERSRYRRPKNQPIPDPDPNSHFIPPIVQSGRCKSTVSSLFPSNFAPTALADNPAATTDSVAVTKKKSSKTTSFRGLGCAASPHVSVPSVIRTSASWEGKKARKRKQKKTNPSPAPEPSPATAPSSVASCLVVPDVWCGPGIGFSTDAASVDCVVSRRPGRGKVDGDNVNLREGPSYNTRRMVNHDEFSFFDTDTEMSHPRFDAFASRHHRHVRDRSPEGLAEILMLQNSLMMGGRLSGLDRYRDWRLDVDNMSYEELLELGDKIGYANTGLGEDEITQCIRKTKILVLDDISSEFTREIQWKCSICQEEYEKDNETGKLDCGHFYHIDCIKQWLAQRKTCPICKTSALSQL